MGLLNTGNANQQPPGLLNQFMENLQSPMALMGLGLLSNRRDPVGGMFAGARLASNLESAALQRDVQRQQIMKAQQERRLEEEIAKARQGVTTSVGPQGPIQPQFMTDREAAAGQLLGAGDLAGYRALGGGADRSAYSRPITGASGVVFADTRNNTLEFVPYPEGGFRPYQVDPSAQGQTAYAKGAGAGQAGLEYKPPTAAEVLKAKEQAQREIDKPRKESYLAASEAKSEMLDQTIEQAIDQSGVFTAGFLGAATTWIPGTPAHNLANTLNTVKANMGIDKLSEMRSQHGGASGLGQLTEREGKKLEQVWGSVEQSQSPAQLRENLRNVQRQVKETWQRIGEEYKRLYGVEYTGSAIPPQPEGVTELEWINMSPEDRELWR